ncbi:flagellar hook-associated protein FlgK [Photobacterium gaetbulicola]|uniref:Flagellar hook-associated protein 1 n=1 Tax=Photobacterium gaetbulicola Gung47 TaxID=658445 RepID=A0A0C5WQX3_9GAMM|nr:flagellar hook-associated protein FlgK [Photobacterium gaetbulicola]AJR09568.1 putative flagellar hook-associated protein FlgK [Photobacterium gaetbulicola Gung47]PSU14361.1 flagellar hook-associated protein FlgK [Photobacterium gaetbulicola]
MALDLLNIGMSGLRTSQKQLNVTSHNISNVNTPGYSRQSAEQKADDAHWIGGSQYGTGAYIDNVRRAYDQFAARELTQSTTQLHQANESHAQLAVMDEFISNNASKTIASMNDYYDSVKSLADHPNDLGSRKAVLENAALVSQTVNSTYETLSGMQRDVNDQLVATVDRVNSLGQEIATLNKRIQENPAGEKNDLFDQQQSLVNELAQYTKVTVLKGKDNLANTVIIGDGQTLVSGTESSRLTVIPGDPDPLQTQIAVDDGHTTKPIESDSMGGILGAMVGFRRDVVERSIDEVGRMAIGFAGQVNTIQRQGLDLNGEQGKNLYADINDPVAMSQRVLKPIGSSAEMAVAIDDVSKLQVGDYKLKASTDGVTNTYQMFNAKGEEVLNQSIQATDPQVLQADGMKIEVSSLSAAPSDETFTIRPVRLGGAHMAMSATEPSDIAAQRVVVDAEGNLGTAQLEPLSTAQVSGSYQVIISNSGDTLSVVDAQGTQQTLIDENGNPTTDLNYPISDNVINFADAMNNGVPTLALSGGAMAGDSFMVQLGAVPAEGDNSNLMAMQHLQTQKTMNNGRSSVIDLFQTLTTDVGIQKMNAEKFGQISQLDFDAASERVASVSGVNLDEEAANLMKFQQAYMASSRIMSVARETFDTLLRAV